MAGKSSLALSLVGVAVVLAAGAGVVWCMGNGHMFGAFIVAAIALGALVPLYPPEEKPDNFV